VAPLCWLLPSPSSSQCLPRLAQAAAGDLDSRFGNRPPGRGNDFSQTEDYAFGIAVKPAGKIVVSGKAGSNQIFTPPWCATTERTARSASAEAASSCHV